MKKIVIVILVLVVVGAVGFGIRFFNVVSNNSVREGTKEGEVDIVKSLVKEFMEEAYIKENYEKSANLYIPPTGFETFLSQEPMTKEEYIAWYVRSVNLSAQEDVSHVQIVSVKQSNDSKESASEELFEVTFWFVKSNSEPVYFGPCCGEEGPPYANMITYVKKIGEDYKVYESLPYIP